MAKFQPSAQPRLLVNVVNPAWLLGEGHCQHHTVASHQLNSLQQFRKIGKARKEREGGLLASCKDFSIVPRNTEMKKVHLENILQNTTWKLQQN